MAKSAPFRSHFRSAGALAGLALLAGCSLQPYTLDIQQGIVIEQKMLDRLKPGMTRNQVGLTLGTPLLTDPLHADRWDYVYYTRTSGVVGDWRHLTLTFKGDQLATISGDVTVTPGGAAPAGDAAPAAAPVPGSGLPAPSPEVGGPRPKS